MQSNEADWSRVPSPRRHRSSRRPGRCRPARRCRRRSRTDRESPVPQRIPAPQRTTARLPPVPPRRSPAPPRTVRARGAVFVHHAQRIAGPAGDGGFGEPVERFAHLPGVLFGTHPHRAVRRGLGGAGHDLRQRDRQRVSVVVVGVLADDVDPAGRDPYAAPGCRAHRTSRSSAATVSGVVSLMKTFIPDSEPARYFNLCAVRRIENSCRCSHQSSPGTPDFGA